MLENHQTRSTREAKKIIAYKVMVSFSSRQKSKNLMEMLAGFLQQ